ncbi:DinB family protein [Ktedonosporobacter rubrisoli]|uniref:DinB family protein n=1 Tax=Ktedonosporobacter rubrisoli TaxID=2509675 RepID=A0A4P6JUV2_KTERU|nr:DinB family protein [Ktedonosporobacter rubrisoli]QBD79427.1 DinB family protein [Ktedonosporobacter rubrisoli]
MDIKTQLTSFHAYLYHHLVNVLIDLTDEQLAYTAPLIDERPLREVALHAYRPLLAVACVACGQEWPPRVSVPTTKEAFLDLLQTMRTHIDALIDRLPSDALELTISLPWQAQQNMIDAFNQNIGHGMFHIGSISGIRASGGFPLPAEESKPQRGKG